MMETTPVSHVIQLATSAWGLQTFVLIATTHKIGCWLALIASAILMDIMMTGLVMCAPAVIIVVRDALALTVLVAVLAI